MESSRVQNDKEHVDIEFMTRPNSLPIAIGSVVLGIVLLSTFFALKRPTTGIGLTLIGVIFSSAFIVLGMWFLYSVVVRRRETPRSLSSEGVEIGGGTIVPWANVTSVEQRPPVYPNGNLTEQTDIKFQNGKIASLSSDWVSNFFEVNEYLIRKSREAGIETPVGSPATANLPHEDQSPRSTVPGEVVPRPQLGQVKGVSEMGSITVEFSMAQTIYVLIITPGCIIFAAYLFSVLFEPSSKLTGWTFYLVLLVPIVFIILGIAFPFLMRLGRRKVARSFSAQGVELWNRTVVPWNEVTVIAGGTQFISTGNGGGSKYRKLDIKFRDGSDVYVSGYWASNFSDVENYLAQMPQYSP